MRKWRGWNIHDPPYAARSRPTPLYNMYIFLSLFISWWIQQSCFEILIVYSSVNRSQLFGGLDVLSLLEL